MQNQTNNNEAEGVVITKTQQLYIDYLHLSEELDLPTNPYVTENSHHNTIRKNFKQVLEVKNYEEGLKEGKGGIEEGKGPREVLEGMLTMTWGQFYTNLLTMLKLEPEDIEGRDCYWLRDKYEMVYGMKEEELNAERSKREVELKEEMDNLEVMEVEDRKLDEGKLYREMEGSEEERDELDSVEEFTGNEEADSMMQEIADMASMEVLEKLKEDWEASKLKLKEQIAELKEKGKKEKEVDWEENLRVIEKRQKEEKESLLAEIARLEVKEEQAVDETVVKVSPKHSPIRKDEKIGFVDSVSSGIPAAKSIEGLPIKEYRKLFAGLEVPFVLDGTEKDEKVAEWIDKVSEWFSKRKIAYGTLWEMATLKGLVTGKALRVILKMIDRYGTDEIPVEVGILALEREFLGRYVQDELKKKIKMLKQYAEEDVGAFTDRLEGLLRRVKPRKSDEEKIEIYELSCGPKLQVFLFDQRNLGRYDREGTSWEEFLMLTKEMGERERMMSPKKKSVNQVDGVRKPLSDGGGVADASRDVGVNTVRFEVPEHLKGKMTPELRKICVEEGRCTFCKRQGHKIGECDAPGFDKEFYKSNVLKFNKKLTKYPRFLDLSFLRTRSVQSLLLVNIEVLGRLYRALIDCGALGNFCGDEICKALGLRDVEPKVIYTVVVADGNKYDRHLKEGVGIKVGDLEEEIEFVGAPIKYDMILGKPWMGRFQQNGGKFDFHSNRLIMPSGLVLQGLEPRGTGVGDEGVEEDAQVDMEDGAGSVLPATSLEVDGVLGFSEGVDAAAGSAEKVEEDARLDIEEPADLDSFEVMVMNVGLEEAKAFPVEWEEVEDEVAVLPTLPADCDHLLEDMLDFAEEVNAEEREECVGVGEDVDDLKEEGGLMARKDGIPKPARRVAGRRHHTTTSFHHRKLPGNLMSLKQFRRVLKKRKARIFEIELTKKGEDEANVERLREERELKEELKQVKTGRNLSAEGRKKFDALLDRFVDRFKEQTGLPESRGKGDFKIEEFEGTSPPFGSSYHMTDAELKELRRQLDEWLSKGFIEISDSPYGAPIFFVIEPTKMRMVTDYRALNNQTRKNRTALPHTREILDRLKDAAVVTSADVPNAFHCILMEGTSIEKTAFRTKYGHYQWKVMPWGLANAPAAFQSLMNEVLKDYIDVFCIVYIDDILIYSKSEEEHLRHLELVFQRLEENNIPLKIRKCKFFEEEVKFVGFMVRKGEIRPDPVRVEKVQDWPVPKTYKDLRSFLGLVVSLGQFIPKLADYTAGFFDLLSGKYNKKKELTEIVEWNADYDARFLALKTAVAEHVALNVIDADEPIYLFADASKVAFGGWIGQLKEGRMRPIALHSVKLRGYQQVYDSYDGEFQSLVQMLDYFSPYLRGHKVYLRTDHLSLQHVLKQKKLNARQVRGLKTLLEYDLEIDWIDGKSNLVADLLTRTSFVAEKSTGVGSVEVECSLVELIELEQSGQLLDALELSSLEVEDWKSEYLRDPYYSELLPYLLDGDLEVPPKLAKKLIGVSYEKGVLYFDGKVCVPVTKVTQLLEEHHDSVLGAHPGIFKTYELVSRHFWFPKMDGLVKKFVASCDQCQRHKADLSVRSGLLNPLEIPERNWCSVGIDFIVDLPKTVRGFDCVTVFICRRSKMVHFALGKKTDTAEDLARQFHATVFKHHGLATDYVTDRDGRFTSEFWSEFSKLLGTTLRVSTAGHHETAGQVENAIKVAKRSIRMFSGVKGEDWDLFLANLEFACNNTVSASTGFTPFMLNAGQEPVTPLTLPEQHSMCRKAQLSFEEFHGLQKLCHDSIQRAQSHQKYYADLKRKEVKFVEGDLVLVSAAQVYSALAKAQKPMMTAKWVGPFEVVEVLDRDNYRLQLTGRRRMHDVFHVSVLKRYVEPKSFSASRSVLSRPDPIFVDDEEHYEVEKIVDCKKNFGRWKKTLYLVKWKGYPVEEASWVAAEHLTNAARAVNAYNRAARRKGRT